MTFRGWGLALRDALRSMTQSSLMSLASVATVAVSLLVLSVVLLLAVNLEFMATTVEEQVEIKAYFCAPDEVADPGSTRCYQRAISPAEEQDLVRQLQAMPEVREAVFVSRAEALQRMKELFGEQRDILDGFEGENPLRDSVEVKVFDAADARMIARRIERMDGVSNVTFGQEYVDKLLAFTRAIRLGGMGLVLLLVVATVLTISNTIRLAVYARRREISIMKLVGATDWYIRRPFMLEGIFLGAFGSLLAMGLTGMGYQRLVLHMYENIPFLPVVSPDELLLNLTVVMILLGSLLGAVGSLISLRRFLKV